MFYTGEAIHRDSDVRVKGLLWSHPIPNYVILLAKLSRINDGESRTYIEDWGSRR